jgi:hypothetical protein
MANILRVAPADLVAWERDPAWEASEAGDD